MRPSVEHTPRLLRSSALRFYAVAGDVPRFVRLFRSTWRKVPSADRRRILNHWHTASYACIALLPRPDSYSPGVFGQCGQYGHEIRVYAHLVDIGSDVAVRFTIAHELVHVLQWARRKPLPETAAPGLVLADDEREREANMIALQWLGLTRRPRIRTPAWRAYKIRELTRYLKAGAPLPDNRHGDRQVF